MRKFLSFILLTTLFLGAGVLGFDASAQFKEKAFTQNYNDQSDTTGRDSTDVMFSFKDYFGGLGHKNQSKIGVVFAGSTVFIGGQQIYNRQYWKLPIFYGTIGGSAALGIVYRNKWKNEGNRDYQHLSNWFFAGAGLAYWACLLDGVGNYNRGVPHQPGKATLYSILLPGLGQYYNGEYWKIPVYYAGLVISTDLFFKNNANYKRYKRIHNEATTSGSGYNENISAETALYYRNLYRRYRDYSIVAMAGFYLLQVIDANVFSYMQDFELSDDISMKVAPTVILPDNMQYASAYNSYGSNFSTSPGISSSSLSSGSLGLKVGFRF